MRVYAVRALANMNYAEAKDTFKQKTHGKLNP